MLMHKSPLPCHLRLPRPRLLLPAMTTVSRKISAASARAHTRKAKQPSHFRLPPGPCSPPSHVSLLFVFFIHLIYVFGLEWLVWIGLCCGFCITVVFFWFVICLFQNGNWGLWVSMVQCCSDLGIIIVSTFLLACVQFCRCRTQLTFYVICMSLVSFLLFFAYSCSYRTSVTNSLDD